MADFVTLTCPNCGGRLEITEDLQRFACGYCGTEHAVRRGGGVVALMPVVEGLGRIQQGTDRTAAELAIVRLQHELAEIREQIKSLTEAETRFGRDYRQCRRSLTPPIYYEDVIDNMRLPQKQPTGFLEQLFGVSVSYYQQGKRLVELVSRLRERQLQLERQREIVDG